MLIQFYIVILSFEAFQVKPSPRFLESRRRFDTSWRRIGTSRRHADNCKTLLEKRWQMAKNHSNLSAVLWEFSGFVNTSPKIFTPESTFLGETLTQKIRKLENRWLKCQSFSEILRISEKVWHETLQNLKYLLKIEGAYLKCKNQKRLTFRHRCILTGQKTGPKISCDSPFNCKINTSRQFMNR